MIGQWKRIAAFLALGIPVNANAQVPISPGQPMPNAPEAPITLDPSRTGSQAPDRPSTPAPSTSTSRPNVVIVGPDGKVIGGDSQPAARVATTFRVATAVMLSTTHPT